VVMNELPYPPVIEPKLSEFDRLLEENAKPVLEKVVKTPGRTPVGV